MSDAQILQVFLNSLPEVETGRLPLWTMFTANLRIYQVTEVRAGGFHKAREWRKGEETEVALIPGTFLANFLPVVARGRLLPIYPDRNALLEQGEWVSYLFSDERKALDAAYLDSSLVRSGDVYVRNHGRRPAFALTDGVHVFRTYYYSRTTDGQPVIDDDAAMAKTVQFRPCNRGPVYWRLLPSWQSSPGGSDDDTAPRGAV